MHKIAQTLTTLSVLASVAWGGALPAGAALPDGASPDSTQIPAQSTSGERGGFVRVAATTTPAPTPTTAVYFSAHPDDFVLFMNPHRDVTQPDTRVVFIFLTAGDAGEGTGPRTAPYYLARENGAFRAVRFMADSENTNVETPTTSTVTLNGHPLHMITYKNTATFFLRLPDGAGEGSGYPIHGWASLMKLKTGEAPTITAVDGSTTYRSWSDLVKTMVEIVRNRSSGTPTVWLDTHEFNEKINPRDHSDHRATGYAATAVRSNLPCAGIVYHVGYSNSGLVNLELSDIETRSGSFANYTSGLAEMGYPGVAWEPTHRSWLTSTVSRRFPGNGLACRF